MSISACTIPLSALSRGGGNNLAERQPKSTGSAPRDEKTRDIRNQNIIAGRALADVIRSSLGPRGMDKMIQDTKNNVIITNDGATILKELSVAHPAARMLVEMSRSQDIEAGDGTTTVVILAGGLLQAASQLLNRGIHPRAISEAYYKAEEYAQNVLESMSTPIDFSNPENLIQAAETSLSSKVVSQNSNFLASLAVRAVSSVVDLSTATDIDLNDIRIVKRLGGTVEDTEFVDGLIFTNQKVSRVAGGPTCISNAKIGLIQFCLSPPKTDIENNIVIKDYQSMDRLLREERVLIASMVKTIADTGCNVLLVQKSILRDAVTDLSLAFLARRGILTIRDIEREDIDFISRTLNCVPIASLDHFTADRLGSAKLVRDELCSGGGRITRISGVPGRSTLTLLCRASNNIVLDETERSLRDVLCGIRCLIKKRGLLPGGGAPEIEVSHRLLEWSRTLPGYLSLCVKEYAEAFEIIPYTLAENAGLKPIEVVIELRRAHKEGLVNQGINVKKRCISDMVIERVVQPLLNTSSTIKLSTETVMEILKIDDIVMTR